MSCLYRAVLNPENKGFRTHLDKRSQGVHRVNESPDGGPLLLRWGVQKEDGVHVARCELSTEQSRVSTEGI